ncbi:MAG: TetR/AcrR family transcriptional regulator [Planctomycetota bacterium]|jgi:AcrR family transcriptional regulator
MAGPERKLEIRAKAAEVFAEKGFDRASIRDLAKAADMSLAGLYYYYRGKDEILFDIQFQSFQTLLDIHAEALAGVQDPIEKLERVIGAHCAFFASHLSEMKVMSREAEQLDGEFEKQVSELRRRYVRLVKGILDEIASQRDVRPETPSDTSVFLLFGMMNWMYTWYDRERDGEPHTIARQIRRIFLDGVLT